MTSTHNQERTKGMRALPAIIALMVAVVIAALFGMTRTARQALAPTGSQTATAFVERNRDATAAIQMRHRPTFTPRSLGLEAPTPQPAGISLGSVRLSPVAVTVPTVVPPPSVTLAVALSDKANKAKAHLQGQKATSGTVSASTAKGKSGSAKPGGASAKKGSVSTNASSPSGGAGGKPPACGCDKKPPTPTQRNGLQ